MLNCYTGTCTDASDTYRYSMWYFSNMWWSRFIPQINGVEVRGTLRKSQMAQTCKKSAKTSMSSKHVMEGVQTYLYFMKYSQVQKSERKWNGKDPGLLWWLPCACCKWCPCGCGQNHLWSFIIVYPFNEWKQHKWHKVIIKWLLGFGIQTIPNCTIYMRLMISWTLSP